MVSEVIKAVNYKNYKIALNYETPSINSLEELNWHKLHTIRKKDKAILIYKTLNENLLHCLQEIFTLRIDQFLWLN